MEKINVAELLSNCPKGMELYSPIFGHVYLDKIRPHLSIVVTTDKEKGDFKEEFLYDGRYGMNGECMLFPSKDKKTWEGFVPPFKFKDGDVVYTICGSIAILGDRIGKHSESFNSCCGLFYYEFDTDVLVLPERLATEEEKEKLFDAIKANRYKWNEGTKTLEKLIEPKFKVGDRVKKIYTRETHVIGQITASGYVFQDEGGIGFIFGDEHIYKLVNNKFDITTFKPFKSRVLVRDYDNMIWIPTFWGKYFKDSSNCRYLTTNGCYKYCIPYEGNEHLLGTTNDCDEYFKIWKK